MDKEENSSPLEWNENYLFVKLLSKYKIILQRPSRDYNRRRQDNARAAFRKECNAKCHSNFTTKQILRKINNIKSRLKEKKFKNETRAKELPYSDWERLFLSLWVDSGITISNDETPPKTQPENTSNLKEPHLETKIPEAPTAEDIVLKFEPEYNSLEDDNISAQNSTQDVDPPTRSESEIRCDSDMLGDKYELMSIDELKRAVLISQLKTLKAQEDAARAKEKYSVHKLLKLQKREL